MFGGRFCLFYEGTRNVGNKAVRPEGIGLMLAVPCTLRDGFLITHDLPPVPAVMNLKSTRALPVGMPRHRWEAVLLLAQLVVLTGCRPEAAVQPGDIRRYAAPRERVLSPDAVAAQPVRQSSASPQLTYTLPPGWTEKAGASGMRLATVAIGEGDEGNEVTIIPAAGTLRSNVERWQKQLDTEATSEQITAAVDRALGKAGSVDVDGRQATVVLLLPSAPVEAAEANASGEAILGGILPLDEGKSLFVKFRGPAELARREQGSFTAFVGSLRLP